jgi:hypothetical protein
MNVSEIPVNPSRPHRHPHSRNRVKFEDDDEDEKDVYSSSPQSYQTWEQDVVGGIGCAATNFDGAAVTLWRSVSVRRATFRRLTLRPATTLVAAQPKPPILL